MNNQQFHRLPFEHKRKYPQPHSCATCKNRPIDFCNSNKRLVTGPNWKWKDDVTDDEVFEAQAQDELVWGHENEDKLKIFYHTCDCFSWGKSTPFYNTDCDKWEWEEVI